MIKYLVEEATPSWTLLWAAIGDDEYIPGYFFDSIR
jgi:hypothetical protein